MTESHINEEQSATPRKGFWERIKRFCCPYTGREGAPQPSVTPPFDPLTSIASDTIHSAVLEALWPLPDVGTKWHPEPESVLVKAEEWCARREAWARSNVTNHRILGHYLRWIGHVRLNVAEVREENATHGERSRMAAFWRKMENQNVERDRILHLIPQPPRF